MLNNPLTQTLRVTSDKDKLQLNKKLPYIILPNNKVELFIKWYNLDLRNLEELPEVFSEGYVEIVTEDLINVQIPSIFDIKSEESYATLKELKNKIKDTYSKMIIHFIIDNNSSISLNGYYADYTLAFNTRHSIKEDNFIQAIRQSILNDKVGKDFKHLPELEFPLRLNLKTTDQSELIARQNDFNRKLGDVCFGLTISIIWYLATSSSNNKYENTNCKEGKKSIYKTSKSSKKYIHNRIINNAIYNLADNKVITIDKLVKRRNGWTISHSFQVRGHYRHYKNGKIVFIQPYKKGKELDNFVSPNIIINPRG